MQLQKITLKLLREANELKAADVADELGIGTLEYLKLEKHQENLKLVDYALICQFYHLDAQDARLLMFSIMTSGLDVEDEDTGVKCSYSEYMDSCNKYAVIGA